MSASDGRLEREQAVRDEVTRQLNGLRADVARETAQAVGAQVSTALDGLSDELARLNSRLDEWQGATGELRLLRERLSVAPRGEMPLGQLDALLMQWFAPGRYVRDFEVGTGSDRYADVGDTAAGRSRQGVVSAGGHVVPSGGVFRRMER